VYPTIKGECIDAQVPDTLDLAERARLAINGLGGNIDPELMTMYGLIYFCCDRPHFSHWASAETLCDPKFAESFPLMRIMCGSDQYEDLEASFRQALVSRIDNGLYWDRYDARRPWRNTYATSFYPEGKDEDFATVPGAGRMLRALMIWRDIGGGSECDELLGELTSGLLRIAVRKDDYCYYPEKGGWGEPCAYPRSGWLNTDEAVGETEGGEGSVTCMHGHQLYGASKSYARTGDPIALELATKLKNYCMLPRFWGGVPDPEGDRTGLPWHIAASKADPAFTSGAEQGHWFSHFHARAITLRGILEFGRSTGDEKALEFVQRAYEFTLSQGIARMGWTNCYPGSLNKQEGCSLGDLVALGIRLSDVGLGDYWDNVDGIVRNQLVEQQLIRADLLEQASAQFAGKDSPSGKEAYPNQYCYDDIIARSIGVFAGFSEPTSLPEPWSMHCCTGNATQGLYYAWEGAVREDGNTATVNLLVNRSAKLIDVDSHLPYEGKVVIRAKSAKRVAVRIPAWVGRRELRVLVGAMDRPLDFVGNYLIVDDLQPMDTITLAFPVMEFTRSYTINAHSPDEMVYTCAFRGGTLVDISPRDDRPTSYPTYLRDGMKNPGPAPMKHIRRFVADRIVRDW
jgi:hypothetical protein